MPLIQYEDESASGTTEDELAVFQMEKGNKKEEVSLR